MAEFASKIALFIDGANTYAAAKTLGFDIEYKRLLMEFQGRGILLRAFYYTAIIEDQEFSSIRPLIDWLDYNGFTVVTKASKEFIDADGRRKVKGNMDIELTWVRWNSPGTSTRSCYFLATAISAPWSKPCNVVASASPSFPRSPAIRRWSPTNCAARRTSSST
jgi:hypothetical protein